MEHGSSALRRLWESGRASWPKVPLELDVFTRAASACARLPDEEIARFHGADLYLACACGLGSEPALGAFEADFLAHVPALISRLDPGGRLADEVLQTLRVQLLVPDANGRVRILDYTGRGELMSWLRVSALRAALKLLRAQKRQGLASDLPEMPDAPDPERDYLKLRYGRQYAQALRDALDRVESGDRLFLKLHYIDGLNIDRIAALYRIHRSTVARRIAACRRTLLELTRERLREMISVSDSEFESVLALVRSEMASALRSAWD
jgi:RNA polymerase sigma-70 factor (ECF subfamily)